MATRAARLELELDRERQAFRAHLSRFGRRLRDDAAIFRNSWADLNAPIAEHPGVSIGLAATTGFVAGRIVPGDPLAPVRAGVAGVEGAGLVLAKVVFASALRRLMP